MPKGSLVNSIKKAFKILEAFSPSSPSMRLVEISERTGLPKVTALRFLRTLVELRYLTYNEREKTYFLSPRVLSLGYTALSSMDLREISSPILRELSDVTGQNVNLGILDGLEIVYIERIKKRQILNIDLQVGSRLSAHNTSIGQVILAYKSKEELDSILSELKKIPGIQKEIGNNGELLLSKLEEIRKKGYALNDGSYLKGLRAIAAPVFNQSGIVDAGVNIPVFADLTTREELLERYLPLLLKATRRISALRGYQDSGYEGG